MMKDEQKEKQGTGSAELLIICDYQCKQYEIIFRRNCRFMQKTQKK